MKIRWYAALSALSLLLFSAVTLTSGASSENPSDLTWEQEYALTVQNAWQQLPQEATGFAVQIPKGSEVFVQLPNQFWEKITPPVEGAEVNSMPDAPEFAPTPDGWSEPKFIATPFSEMRFRVEDLKNPASKIRFAFYDTRVAAAYETAATKTLPESGGLKIISRAEWGADESLRYTDESSVNSSSSAGEEESVGTQVVQGCNNLQDRYPDEYEINRVVSKENGRTLRWPYEYSARINKVVIHHTASAANFERDPKEVVRGIYAYHARSRGWGDIGYHYLIDPYGNIYQGRAGGDYVVAGHVYCSNVQTLGIALMGNFQNENPTPDQIRALGKLLPMLAGKYQLDLTTNGIFHGDVTPNLLGHRDLGATACPGENMYALIPELRKGLKNSDIIKRLSSINRSAKPLSKVSILNLKSQQTQKLSYQFENTGNVTWGKSTWLYVVQPSSGVSVTSQAEGKSYVAGLMKEASVPPGSTATFEVEIRGGLKKGLHSLEFTPVVSERKVASASVVQPVEVTGTPTTTSPYSARLLTPRVMRVTAAANGQGTAIVKLINTGKNPWQQNELKLTLVSGSKKSDITMRERVVRAQETATFDVPLKIGQNGLLNSFRIMSGSKAVPGLAGRIIFRRALPLRPAVTAPSFTPPAPPAAAKNIRIRLGIPDSTTATVLASTGAKILVDGKEISELEKNKPITLEQKESYIQFLQNSGSVIRLMPKEPNGIFTISSWDRSPAWDTAKKLNDNKFRGTLELRVYDSKLAIINELPLEEYLWGLAETSNSTAKEKQKVMAIIARTYAAFYMKPENRKYPNAPYDGDDSPNTFQKYLGYGYELRSQDFVAAAKATAGKVVTYKGKLVKTPYFSQSDGRTLSAEEVWGWTDTPWLQSVPDPYSAGLERLGHGVGLSGKGAEEAAKAGKSYDEIIKYYYQGVEIGSL